MARKNPLGENPLTPDSVVRAMVRGDREKKQESDLKPMIRKKASTTTPGGLLRKTVYFTESEWRAIKTHAFQEDRAYTDIIREAVREVLEISNGEG